MPFVGGGYRDEFLSPDPKRQQVGIGGDGAGGPEGEGALGALAVHPAERLCFSQSSPPSSPPLQILQTGPSYRAIMEMQL